MDTLTLFDAQRARTSDPDSSHIAADQNKSSGRRRTQGEMMLAALKTANGSTSAEIGRILEITGQVKNTGLARNMASRRLSDLRNEGKVVNGETRNCRICFIQCETWFITETFGPNTAITADE